MSSVGLERLRDAIRDDERATTARRVGAKMRGKQRLIEQALSSRGEWPLWQRIRDCGTNRRRCGSPHCVKCHERFVRGQERLMKQLFGRYLTESDQRNNIRHLTALFDAYGFELESKTYPVFPMERTIDGIKYARDEIQALKRRFQSIKILGGLELEPLDGIARGLRHNQETITALLSASCPRDIYGHVLYKLAPPSGMETWSDHIIMLHAHLVVDLNGADGIELHEWCHRRWGNTRSENPVPRGVLITPLRYDRSIDESVSTLARYPLKTPFHYHVQKNKDGLDVAIRRALEPEILSAMVVGQAKLGIRGLRVSGRL